MRINFRGSRTEQLLINAFAGEAQAYIRYKFFASTAKKENLCTIADVFTQTAENEYEHAKLFYKLIGYNKNAHVDSFYPFEFGSTSENLLCAIDSENEEASVIYLNACKIAKEEGFDTAASVFKNVINVEIHHRDRFQQIYTVIKENSLFKKDSAQLWICTECGYIHNGTEAPEYCPNCYHKRGYFKLLCEKY